MLTPLSRCNEQDVVLVLVLYYYDSTSTSQVGADGVFGLMWFSTFSLLHAVVKRHTCCSLISCSVNIWPAGGRSIMIIIIIIIMIIVAYSGSLRRVCSDV